MGWQGPPRVLMRFIEHVHFMVKYRLVCEGGLATVSLLLRGLWKGQAAIVSPYKPPMKDKSTVPDFCPEMLCYFSMFPLSFDIGKQTRADQLLFILC